MHSHRLTTNAICLCHLWMWEGCMWLYVCVYWNPFCSLYCVQCLQNSVAFDDQMVLEENRNVWFYEKILMTTPNKIKLLLTVHAFFLRFPLKINDHPLQCQLIVSQKRTKKSRHCWARDCFYWYKIYMSENGFHCIRANSIEPIYIYYIYNHVQGEIRER